MPSARKPHKVVKVEEQPLAQVEPEPTKESNVVQYEYISAGANIASVIEDMYHNIYKDLAGKTDNPHELTIQLINAGFSSAMASINIKANYSKITVHKIGFSSN